MNTLKYLIAFAFILGISSMASAAPQPPPVNQNLGIPDSNFEHFPVNLCITCHHAYKTDDPLALIGERPRNGAPVKPGYNPDRHHTVMDKFRYPIKNIIDGMPDYPPFRDVDGLPGPDTNYTCYNCHKILTDIATGETNLDAVILPNFRNCLNCHERRRDSRLTVHHATELAQTGFCYRCHGGFVRGIDVVTLEGKKPDPASSDPNATVPVVVPTYQPSMITPWRSKKPNGDDSIVTTAGASPGNCNFCHNTDIGNDRLGIEEPLTLNDGSTIMVNIFTNKENHHNTGFYTQGKCAWCHYMDFGQPSPQADGYAIRICQRCHDRSSLHNIEFDDIGDGIQPGAELPYFGHIGNFKNCWGCHGNNNTIVDEDGTVRDPATLEVITSPVIDMLSSSVNTISGVLVPTLTSVSELSISEGTEVTLIATGSNFDNVAGGNILWTSRIVIRDSSGNVTEIPGTVITDTSIEFTLPATFAAGAYEIMVKKAAQHTTAIPLIIKPSIKVDLGLVYTPYGGMVILIGNDFVDSNGIPVNIGAGFSLVDQNGTKPIEVYAWYNNIIIAQFQDIPTNVTVTNIYDEKTVTLEIY